MDDVIVTNAIYALSCRPATACPIVDVWSWYQSFGLRSSVLTEQPIVWLFDSN